MSRLRRTPRGAVRRQKRQFMSGWWLQLKRLLPVAIGLGLLLGAGLLLHEAVIRLQQQPVSRVLFTGELAHVSRDELVAEVEPLLAGSGFVTVNLERIRAELLALPWVDEVAVTRSWPDELIVRITEQRPIALWGDDALLNHRGEIFRPQHRGDTNGLPHLVGPDLQASEVVGRFGALSTLLSEQELQLVRLSTDARGGWIAELDGGVTLNLGRGDVMKKMQRFLIAYRNVLQQQFDQVAYVDLRHDNGLAVGWKNRSAGVGIFQTTATSGSLG